MQGAVVRLQKGRHRVEGGRTGHRVMDYMISFSHWRSRLAFLAVMIQT